MKLDEFFWAWTSWDDGPSPVAARARWNLRQLSAGKDAGHAGRLRDRLIARFGEDQVFMDVDAIEPGVDFAEEIEGATMPRRHDLPEGLARRNALSLRHESFRSDADRLLVAIEPILRPAAAAEAAPHAEAVPGAADPGDVAPEPRVVQIVRHRMNVNGMAFSPNGHVLATGARIVSPPSGRPPPAVAARDRAQQVGVALGQRFGGYRDVQPRRWLAGDGDGGPAAAPRPPGPSPRVTATGSPRPWPARGWCH